MKNMNHLNKVLLVSLVALTLSSSVVLHAMEAGVLEDVVETVATPSRLASAWNALKTAGSKTAGYIANAAGDARNTRGIKSVCDQAVAHPRIAKTVGVAAILSPLAIWGANKLYCRYWKSPVSSSQSSNDMAPGFSVLADVSEQPKEGLMKRCSNGFSRAFSFVCEQSARPFAAAKEYTTNHPRIAKTVAGTSALAALTGAAAYGYRTFRK